MKPKTLALKETFNLVPALYDEIRPGYPAEFVRQIKEYAQLPEGADILELGPGTGQMTGHFIDKDYHIWGLELGENMAKFMTQKFAAYKNIEIKTQSFEEWEATDSAFDLFISAQAFHWIDPEFGINKAAKILRPGGTIALVWNLDVSENTPFYKSATPLHEKYYPAEPEDRKPCLGAHFGIYRDTLKKSAAFAKFTVQEFDWEKVYSSEEWIKLKNTFSPDLRMPVKKREQFHSELKQLIDEEFGGKATRYYRAVSVMAKKVSAKR